MMDEDGRGSWQARRAQQRRSSAAVALTGCRWPPVLKPRPLRPRRCAQSVLAVRTFRSDCCTCLCSLAAEGAELQRNRSPQARGALRLPPRSHRDAVDQPPPPATPRLNCTPQPPALQVTARCSRTAVRTDGAPRGRQQRAAMPCCRRRRRPLTRRRPSSRRLQARAGPAARRGGSHAVPVAAQPGGAAQLRLQAQRLHIPGQPAPARVELCACWVQAQTAAG